MTPWEGIPIALVGLGPEMVVGGGDEFQPASNADQHELKGEWECIGGAMDVRRDWRRPQRIECLSDGYRPSKPLQPESSPRHIVFSHGKQSMAHIYRGVERLPASGPMVGSLAQPPQRQAGSTAQPASHPATQCRDVQRTASVATSILEYLPNQATESNCGRGLQADRADMVRGQISRYPLTWQASRRGHDVRAAKIESSYVSQPPPGWY